MWKGTLSIPDPSGTVIIDITATFAWDEDERRRMADEEQILTHLQAHCVEGVPISIGMYQDEDDNVPVLVTTYPGEQIEVMTDEIQ